MLRQHPSYGSTMPGAPRLPLSVAAPDGAAAAAASPASAGGGGGGGDSAPPSPAATSPAASLSVESELNHIAFGRFQTMALLVLGLANASDAVELLCLSFILPVIDAGYTAQDKALLSAGIFVGMLVGGLVFGVAADRYGRRVTLCVSLVINAFFGLLSAITPSFGVLLAARVMAGFGVGGSIPGVFTLAAELLPSKDRGFWLSTVAWWWMFGSVYAAGLAWIMLGYAQVGWQGYAALCTLPAAVAAVLIYTLLPESPRFLHNTGDAEGAARALIAIAAWNGRPSRLSQGWVLRGVGEEGWEGEEEEEEEDEGGKGREAFALGAADGKGGSPGSAAPAAAAAAAAAEGGEGSSAAAAWALGVSPEGGKPSQGAPLSARAAPAAALDSESQGLLGGSGGSAALKPLRAKGSAASSSGGGGSTPSKGRRSVVFAGGGGVGSGRMGAWCGACALPSGMLGPMREMFSQEHLRTTLLLSYVWFALSFGWYGLILWIPTLFSSANVDLNPYQDSFLVAASNLPGNLLSALLMDRVGRKGILTGSLVAACASAIAFRFAKTELTVVLAACTLNAVSTCSWNSLDCLSTESFPTGLRTSALGLLAATGRVGSIVGQFVFGSLVDGHTNELLILAGIVLGTGAAASVALPKFQFKE